MITCNPLYARRALVPLLSFAALTANCLSAQSENPKATPYATLDRQSVTYRGPINALESDIPAQAAVIGLIVPLQGPQKAQGDAIQAAVRLALEEEQVRGTLPDGRALSLVVRDESGPWGQASREIFNLIEQDHAVALLTSADGNIAHQAEQLANKISFPILTLASDPTTTETNIPWLFRLGPSDCDQARVFAERIYISLGARNVLLIAEADHDGRTGASEFEKAAKRLNAPAPQRLNIPASSAAFVSFTETIRASQADAVVLWTDPNVATTLLPIVRQELPSSRVFLCSKAAQLDSKALGQAFTVGMPMTEKGISKLSFADNYLARTGLSPSSTAFLAHQAVHVLAAGLRKAGTNRALLRDFLAHSADDRASIIVFDPAGNCLSEFAIVELSPTPRNIASK